jgi:hypothetical protein
LADGRRRDKKGGHVGKIASMRPEDLLEAHVSSHASKT